MLHLGISSSWADSFRGVVYGIGHASSSNTGNDSTRYHSAERKFGVRLPLVPSNRSTKPCEAVSERGYKVGARFPGDAQHPQARGPVSPVLDCASVSCQRGVVQGALWARKDDNEVCELPRQPSALDSRPSVGPFPELGPRPSNMMEEAAL